MKFLEAIFFAKISIEFPLQFIKRTTKFTKKYPQVSTFSILKDVLFPFPMHFPIQGQ